jgi:phosphoribosyl-ATP pyrophosphohydrolase
MAKSDKKRAAARPRKPQGKLSGKLSGRLSGKKKKSRSGNMRASSDESDAIVLDRLFTVVESRRDADPTISHSARLLSRGPAKVAQKFGEEAVECLIEAVAGNRDALIAESADVLYHLLVLWVSSGVSPSDVWAELIRREGISGIAEKAARAKPVVVRKKLGTSKIP